MSKRNQTPYDLIASEPRSTGWKNFTDNIEKIISRGMSTEETLLLLHRLVTFGTPHRKIPSFIAEVVFFKSLILAGLDGESMNELKLKFPKEIKKRIRLIVDTSGCPQIGLNTLSVEPSIFGNPQTIAKRIEVSPSILRRGHLRSFGTAKINGKKKDLYTAHETPLYWNGEDLGYAYEGLEEGLGEVFTALCKKFDDIMQKETDLRNKLRAIILFQVLGTIIHPFFDANGRAFTAHCVLELNKLGFPIKEIPTLPEIDETLNDNIFSSMSGHLLHVFLKTENIPLLQMKRLQVSRAVYMKTLKVGLMKRINEGIEGNKDFLVHIDGTVQLLICWLSKHRYIPGDNGEYYQVIGAEFKEAYETKKKPK